MGVGPLDTSMPGRIGLYSRHETIEDRFGARLDFDYEPRYNIAPSSDMAVIRNDEPDVIDTVEWGFVVAWQTERIKFARSETVAEKRTFKEPFAERRCLVLADGYYEWNGDGNNQPYWIYRADQEPFAIAGLWNPADGHDRPTGVLLTTEPSASIEHIHDRMAVILDPGSEDTWLTATDPDELQQLLQPFPPDQLDSHPVSTKVNHSSSDAPDLIEPKDTGDQAGLDDFG